MTPSAALKQFLFALAVGALAATHAFAQSYPSKPIRIVVPYPPGGFNDTLGRTLAAKFIEAWGQPAIVENKPGANTLIGSDLVAKAPADGYTLLIVAFPFAVTPSLIRNMPYDTVKDFAPVVLAAQSPNILVVNPEETAPRTTSRWSSSRASRA